MGSSTQETNQVYRKKYFVESGKVLFCPRVNPADQLQSVSRVIDAASVTVAKRPVEIHLSRSPDGEQIKVDTIREGQKVKSIRIACPCGRRAELNVEYAD